MKITTDRQSGDTLIEVLLAMTILSVIIVTAMAMMNRGVAATMAATEHTTVRMKVSAQVEYLNYIRDSYMDVRARGMMPAADTPGGVWQRLTSTANNHVTDAAPDDKSGAACEAQVSAPIYLDVYDGDFANALKVQEKMIAEKPGDIPASGLWIEGFRSSGIPQRYVDFVIRACWEPLGEGVTQQESTVVRLYDAN